MQIGRIKGLQARKMIAQGGAATAASSAMIFAKPPMFSTMFVTDLMRLVTSVT